MSRIPTYSNIVSHRLSEVFDEIGINVHMVLKRRRVFLLRESMATVVTRFYKHINNTWYTFGSQTEGTSTNNLNSDIDSLYSQDGFNVIQSWDKWEMNKINVLMVQYENTTPGYCMLQLLRDDEPLPYQSDEDLSNESFALGNYGEVFLKPTFLKDSLVEDRRMEGPSQARSGRPGYLDEDIVIALPCKEWLRASKSWDSHKGAGYWPSKHVKELVENSVSFVVPVGGKVGENDDAEWRLSTSTAERILMFSLNITQIRCYVLMKMILKTFIPKDAETGKILTSFMCKTILLHCCRNTHPDFWQERNTFLCISMCLLNMQYCVQNKTCQHFTIPENNLMRGKINDKMKTGLVQVIQDLVDSEGRFLLQIIYDNLGDRLYNKFSALEYGLISLDIAQTEQFLEHDSAYALVNLAIVVSKSHKVILEHMNVKKPREDLNHLMTTINDHCGECFKLERVGCNLIVPLVQSTVGSILASSDIRKHKTLSKEALDLLYLGENADTMSGKLKLASVYYRAGNIQLSLDIIESLEQQYDEELVESACGCYDYPRPQLKSKCKTLAYENNEEFIKTAVAFCVRFLPREKHVIPDELRHELRRSKADDVKYRNKYEDTWMDYAVVDSIILLHFLRYKINKKLQRPYYCEMALANLKKAVTSESNLGHLETACNILGQCMELEKRFDDARDYYIQSLAIRSRNNAANFHIRRINTRIKKLDRSSGCKCNCM